jgi:ribosomal protein L19E
MWTVCNEAQAHILDQVWMESNAVATPTKAITKATIRRLTYQALIDYLETADGCAPA